MRGITEERLKQKFKEHEDNKTQIAEGYRFAIAACISECQELNPWQQIKTAPKDREILLYTKEYERVIGMWFNAGDRGWWTAHCMPVTPTNWMELPEPPK